MTKTPPEPIDWDVIYRVFDEYMDNQEKCKKCGVSKPLTVEDQKEALGKIVDQYIKSNGEIHITDHTRGDQR